MNCLFCQSITRPYYYASDSEVCEVCDTRYLVDRADGTSIISYYFNVRYKDAIYTASFFTGPLDGNVPPIRFLLYSSKDPHDKLLLRLPELPNFTPFNLVDRLKKLLVFS